MEGLAPGCTACNSGAGGASSAHSTCHLRNATLQYLPWAGSTLGLGDTERLKPQLGL